MQMIGLHEVEELGEQNEALSRAFVAPWNVEWREQRAGESLRS